MCPCPQVGSAYQPISGGKNAEIKKKILKLNGLFCEMSVVCLVSSYFQFGF